MTTGLAFFVSVFFAPIFASIPPWATGGALVIVGTLMARNVREINWNYIGDAVPAFLTMIIIPLSYKYVFYPYTAIWGRGLTLAMQHRLRSYRRHYLLYLAQWCDVAFTQGVWQPHRTASL